MATARSCIAKSSEWPSGSTKNICSNCLGPSIELTAAGSLYVRAEPFTDLAIDVFAAAKPKPDAIRPYRLAVGRTKPIRQQFLATAHETSRAQHATGGVEAREP
jgi:hypothetical protein